jgi:hypothetical protein
MKKNNKYKNHIHKVLGFFYLFFLQEKKKVSYGGIMEM